MKRLLIEVQVSDEGAKVPTRAGWLIEDALYGHMQKCVDNESEKLYFGSQNVRVRVLTEDSPL